VRLEGLGQLKNGMTSSSGIEPATFRLVALLFNLEILGLMLESYFLRDFFNDGVSSWDYDVE
jgi:hypothetical protein